MLHKYVPKFEFFYFFFENFQTKVAWNGANIICHVLMHTCAKFGLIWAMLDEEKFPKHENGVNEHDRPTSYLILLR